MRISGGKVSVASNLPHGVLGPVLFLIYVNDPAALSVQGSFVIFADDATILWRHRDEEILRRSAEGDLLRIREWCDANWLVFNVTKTSILSFKCDLGSITFDEKIVESRTVVRLLGVHIDSKLRFETHIKALNKKTIIGLLNNQKHSARAG